MSSRRKTLGPVNRTSTFVGGATPSAGAKKKGKKGRQSMMPRMAGNPEPLVSPSPTLKNRRKSVAGVNRRKTILPSTRVDPRPISDRAFQAEQVKQLIQFLQQSEYDQLVTTKTLAKGPTTKDFKSIVTFMLRRIDPTFHRKETKFEDEVAMMFKGLGYPFPVSKTSLAAVGSPHTWPALLAALSWLMETIMLLDYADAEEADRSETQFETIEELEAKSDKDFFRFLHLSYFAFLQGDAEKEERLADDLVEEFEKDNMFLEQRTEEIVSLNCEIIERLNQLSEGDEELPELEQKRNDLATQVEQYHQLLTQMNEQYAQFSRQFEDRTLQLKLKNQQIEEVKDRIKLIEEKIRVQDLSVDDVRKMRIELQRLVESAERFAALKQERSKELLDAEAQLTYELERLENTITECNARMTDVSRFSDIKFKVEMDEKNAGEKDQRKLLGVDIQSEVIPALTECKTAYAEKTAAARLQHQELISKVKTTEAARDEALDGLKILQGKITKLEEELSRERDEQKEALAMRKRELESTECKIVSLRDPVALKGELAKLQKQATDLQAARKKHRETSIVKKQAVQDQIKHTMQAISAYKQDQRNMLERLNLYVQEKKASLETVTVPSTETLEE